MNLPVKNYGPKFLADLRTEAIAEGQAKSMTTTATQLAEALEEGWACDTSPDEMTAAAAELRRLSAEVEALRKDAERYRWLHEHALGMDAVADPDNFVCIWHGTDPSLRTYGRTLDAAIDMAAMKGAANG